MILFKKMIPVCILQAERGKVHFEKSRFSVYIQQEAGFSYPTQSDPHLEQEP